MSTLNTTEEANKLLSQLKDIHLPAPSGGWTPVIHAWWIPVAGVCALLLLSLLIRRYYLRTRTRRYALAELNQMQARYNEHRQPQRLLNELNTLLRRMAMINHEREKVSPLSGKHWLEFLDRSGRTKDFSNGEGRILVQAYQAEPDSFDEAALIEVVKKWIKRQL